MNPRAYPRGPRYRVSARPRPVESRRSRRPRFVIAGATVGLVVVGVALAVLFLPIFKPSTEGQESSGTAMDATRPRDLAPTTLVLTPAPYPSPLPTATPRPIPTADPSLTTAEVASIIRFANSLMFLEMRQRNLIRDYRIYDIDLLTRWIGESIAGAEDLLEKQRRILNDFRTIEGPDLEGADMVLSLYEDSIVEGVETFERLVDALQPLDMAGISVVGGIRTGMLPNIGVSDGLSRSAMARIAARKRLEWMVNRAGLTLGDVQNPRSPDAEDI